MNRIASIALCCFSLAAAALGQPVTFTTLAGPDGGPGTADGLGSAARFQDARAVAADAAGNLYVADTYNHTIRKVTPAGEVTTLAGLAGVGGSADGQGSAARFLRPEGIAADAAGILYVSDTANSTIRKVTPAGLVTTIAGRARFNGSADGQGITARFENPKGLAVDAAGDFYVTDTSNHTIRKVTPAGFVTTVAGIAGAPGAADGQGMMARFNAPRGIVANAAGDFYVTDSLNNSIRRVTAAGDVSTFVGPGVLAIPNAITADAAGNVYVTDGANHAIRKVTPGGVVTTLAGVVGSWGTADGQGGAARFHSPTGIAVDAADDLYVTDSFNHTLRKVTAAGDVTTLAGLAGGSGSADGQGSGARFSFPEGIAADAAGNTYVTDTRSSTIRKVTPSGDVTTLAGLAGSVGSDDGQGSAARFNRPRGIAIDGGGNLYVTDTLNHTLRRVTPAGEVTTFAGLAGSSGSTEGQGSAARFFSPEGVAADAGGNLYVTDTRNATIRKITPAGNVTTLAGLAGNWGSADGQGSAAQFFFPAGVAADAAGNVYVTDSWNFTIRKVTATGEVTTLAGLAGSPGGTDGQGSAARFSDAEYIAVDPAGNLFVTDTHRQTIRKITAAGNVTTLAGLALNVGTAAGTGEAARFQNPAGIAIDLSGILYVTDTYNERIQVGRPGLLDSATIDCGSGSVGFPSALDVLPRTATSWQWTTIRRPSGSSAVLSSVSIPDPTFTPDVADLYEFSVVASDGVSSSITTVTLLAAPFGYYGDLDENATVDATDLVILASSLVGNMTAGVPPFTAPADAADLDRDAAVSATDLVLLANYLVGNICGLPVV